MAEDFGFVAPEVTQAIAGKKIEPVVVDQRGRIVLAKATDRNLYILADPDLLNNHGMADPKQAAAALSMLDLHEQHGRGFHFVRRDRERARPFAEPAEAGVRAALPGDDAGAVRRGCWPGCTALSASASRAGERAIAFGKAALVDNSAALIRIARREARLGGAYAEMIRERAAACSRRARR